MRRFFRYPRYGRFWALPRLLLAALALALLAMLAVGMIQLRSMLTRLATSRVSNAVNQIVSSAVDDAVANGSFQYEQMISFEKDNDGKITAVKSNMPEFNRLQSAILNDILVRIDQVSSRDLSIPLGSLTGSNLLSGRGPLVTVRMQSIGTSTATLQNSFTSAGINQTRHQILLNVDVYVSILLPGFTTATRVSNSITVAETVIVGSVPGSYTYFNADESLEETAEQYILNGN